MSVLCEAISVIVRVDVLEARHHGGVEGYRRSVPNATYCTDGVLTRVGFATREEAGWWIRVLRIKGLVVGAGERCPDIAVVDEQGGPSTKCDWVETAVVGGVRRAWSVGATEGVPHSGSG